MPTPAEGEQRPAVVLGSEHGSRGEDRAISLSRREDWYDETPVGDDATADLLLTDGKTTESRRRGFRRRISFTAAFTSPPASRNCGRPGSKENVWKVLHRARANVRTEARESHTRAHAASGADHPRERRPAINPDCASVRAAVTR